MLSGLSAATLAVLALHSLRDRGGAVSLRALHAVLFLLCAAALAAGVDEAAERWTVDARWKSFARDTEMVGTVDSRYQNIALGRQAGQYNLYLNGYYSESFPDPYGQAAYVHFVMVQHPRPRSVLLIGSGLTGAIRRILLHDPDRVDYVELDEVLLEFLEGFLPVGEREAAVSPSVRIVADDGRHFVKEMVRRGESGLYDLVILNVPEPSNAMLNRFYTLDFFRELSRLLEPGGVVAASLPFTENYIREEVLQYGKSIYGSLEEVFEDVVVTPGTRIFFFASNAKGVITTDPAVLESRYLERGIESDYFSRYHYSMLLLPERVEFVRKAFEGGGGFAKNTDANPVTYYLGFRLWDRFSGGQLAPLLGAAGRITLGRLAILLLVFFALRIGLGLARGESGGSLAAFSSLLSIFTTGAAGMSVSVVLMFSFQNAVGYLYGEIGALVALFMFGLAAGGWASGAGRLWKGSGTTMTVLESVSIGFLLVLSVLLPRMQGAHALSSELVEAVYLALMFVCGVLTGAVFPLSSSIYVRETGRLGRGAGLVDALDHGGALLGAFVTGVMLVPVAGLAGTLVLVSALKGLGLLFWLYLRTFAE